MARRAILLALCLMFLPMMAFAQGTEAKDEGIMTEGNKETRDGVLAALRNYIAAYEAKDIDGVMAVFADAPNTVMMGTGADELWVGKDEIRMAHSAFMSNFDKETSEQKIMSVGADGNVAWLTGYVDLTRTDSEGISTSQLNLSIVLKKIEKAWYITAMHFSKLTSP